MSLQLHCERGDESVEVYSFGWTRAKLMGEMSERLGLASLYPDCGMVIEPSDVDTVLADVQTIERAYPAEVGQWDWLREELRKLKTGEYTQLMWV